VLAKIASIVNDQAQLDILVEGHTDNVPISTDCYVDNWDLSAKRATSVVRTLQTKFKVDPSRMTAGGRSEFTPKIFQLQCFRQSRKQKNRNYRFT
jgi:chemotaxis protein MotB